MLHHQKQQSDMFLCKSATSPKGIIKSKVKETHINVSAKESAIN